MQDCFQLKMKTFYVFFKVQVLENDIISEQTTKIWICENGDIMHMWLRVQSIGMWAST